jgi:uncharacterized DUF497 family protein
METSQFEWDEVKNAENIRKHGVSFEEAQHAFSDPLVVIAEDEDHSQTEVRYFGFGKVSNRILTVRFTYRGEKIRIFGAGYWRQGKAIYEKENKIH